MPEPPTTCHFNLTARDAAFDHALNASGLLNQSTASAPDLARSVDTLIRATRLEDSQNAAVQLKECADRIAELESRWLTCCHGTRKSDHQILCQFFQQRERYRQVLIEDVQAVLTPDALTETTWSLFKSLFLPSAVRDIPHQNLPDLTQKAFKNFALVYQNHEWRHYHTLFTDLKKTREWTVHLSRFLIARIEEAHDIPRDTLSALQQEYLNCIEWKAQDLDLQRKTLSQLFVLIDLIRSSLTRKLGVVFQAEQACVAILDAEVAWQKKIEGEMPNEKPFHYFREKSRFRIAIALRLLYQVMRLVRSETEWQPLWEKWVKLYDSRPHHLYPQDHRIKDIPARFHLPHLNDATKPEDLDCTCCLWQTRIQAFLNTELALCLLPSS